MSDFKKTAADVPVSVAAATATSSIPPTVEALVERWFAESFFNVGLDTQLVNRLRTAKDRLKVEIADLSRKD